MKIIKTFFFLLFFLIIIIPIAVLSWFGFIPGLSKILGANKPKNLGIVFQEADLKSGRAKGEMIHEFTKEVTLPEKSWQTFGSKEVKAQFSSAEITAIMNNRPGAYYPYKNIQVKFNEDGSGEISGSLVKSRIPTYAATFDTPKIAVDFVMKLLPENPVFYLKGRAVLTDNKVTVFEPQQFEIGRIPLPVGIFISLHPQLKSRVFAMDITEMTNQLSQIEDKKSLFIQFINSRISNINGFYAKSAYAVKDKLIFEGTIPEKEVVTE